MGMAFRMERRDLIKLFYPILKLFSRIYFFVIQLIFEIINYNKPKTVVLVEKESLILISATKAAEQIRNGELTSQELVQAYVDRIKKVNPFINAVIHENYENALKEAEKVDAYLTNLDKFSEEFYQLSYSKPLLGVPFTVKDNLKVKGFITYAGTSNYVNNRINEEDAEIVKRIKDSGAILLAVSSLPKLAGNWQCKNSIIGATNNPYDLRRSPGGSSGGEGALITSACSLFGLGNDVGGSVRIPAHFCGIFGLYPSNEIVPLNGIVPEIIDPNHQKMWSNGPLCRYAEDLEIVLKCIAGPEKANILKQTIDFKNIRVYYLDQFNSILAPNLTKEIQQSILRVCRYFETTFGILAHRVDFSIAHHSVELWLARFLDDGLPLPLSECISKIIYSFNEKSNDTFLTASIGTLTNICIGNNDEKKFIQSKCAQLREEIQKLLRDDGILILPVSASHAPFNHQTDFTQFNNIYTMLFNALGLPAIACPIGLGSNGLPLGVQIVGSTNSDGLLIAAAKEVEKGFGGWVAPGSMPNSYKKSK